MVKPRKPVSVRTSNQVECTDFDLPAASDIQIDIIDELGRTMYNLHIPKVKRETILMNVEFLDAAMYFIKIETGETTRVIRFIKHTD